MPGFIGAISAKKINSEKAMSEASSLLKYHSWYNSKSYEFTNFTLTKINSYKIPNTKYRSKSEDVIVWVDGEYYNHKDFSDHSEFFNKEKNSLCHLLMHAFQTNSLENILKQIDGEFTAVLFDQKRNLVKIITDRNGLRPLYIYQGPSEILFASEIKAFLSFESFHKTINQEAVDSFLDFGHLLWDQTWFENCVLTDPASITTINLSESRVTDMKFYWTWEDISCSTISLEDAVLELQSRFNSAVQSRIFPEEEKPAVLLSGGLDSRVIYGVLEKEQMSRTLTFGQPLCWDEQIAKKLSGLRNISHTFYEITAKNWLQNKKNSLWRSDGMVPISDLHASPFLFKMREHSPININGFLGDPIVGANYLKKESLFNTRATPEITEKIYPNLSKIIPSEKQYFNTPHLDPLFLLNRGRRSILSGCLEASKTIEQRKPFMSNSVMELMYSLPDEFRFNNKLYFKYCSETFPKLFQLPIQKTGLPLSTPDWVYNWVHRFRKVMMLLGGKDHSQLVNHPTLFNHKGSKKQLDAILNSPNKHIQEYTQNRAKYIQPRWLTLKSWEAYSRRVSLEIWLQQIFEKKYRED